MPRSKQDQRIAMDQNNKISMEPILQDFSITSLSEMSSEVFPPNDSSLFEKVRNYDVALPDLTLNQTNDINLSSDQYPPDTTIMDMIKIDTPQALFKRPFNPRSKRKPRPSLIENDIEDSGNDTPEPKIRIPFKRKAKVAINESLFETDLEDSENDTPEPKIRIPFQRKAKVAINEKEFENLLNSSNDSICTLSNVNSNFITRRKNRKKKNIDNTLFDSALNSSESDKSFSLRRTLLKRKVNSKKVTSTEIDEISYNTLDASQIDGLEHKIPFKNRLQNKQTNNESALFDSDINSTNSFQDSSRVLLSEDNKRDSVQILNKNKRNCSKNSFDKLDKDSSLKMPFRNRLQREQKNVEMGLFDSDLNSSESFQESSRLITHEDKKRDSQLSLDKCINDSALSNTKKVDKDSYTISESNKSTSKSLSEQNIVESLSFDNERNSSYSLRLSCSLTSNKEKVSELNNILNGTNHHRKSRILSESSISRDQLMVGEGKEESLKSSNLSQVLILNSERPNIINNSQRIEHSKENYDLEAIESSINNTNKSINTEMSCCNMEEFGTKNLFKNVPEIQNDKSLLNLKEPEYNRDVELIYSQNNKTTVLDEKEKSGENNSSKHTENLEAATSNLILSEFNQLLPNETSNKHNILDNSNGINELVVNHNDSENCSIHTSLPKENEEHSGRNKKQLNSSNVHKLDTDKLAKDIDIECESSLNENVRDKDTYLITRKSILENSNNIFIIDSLQCENVSKIQTKSISNIDLIYQSKPTSNIDFLTPEINLSSNIYNSRDQPTNVNCERIDISTLKKQKLRRSVRKSIGYGSNYTEQQSPSNIEQSEFSLFVEQSSKPVSSDSEFIDIHASTLEVVNGNVALNLTNLDQASKSVSGNDTLPSAESASSSITDDQDSLENNDQTSVEDEFTEKIDDILEEEEIVEEQHSTTDEEEEIEDESNVEENTQEGINFLQEEKGEPSKELSETVFDNDKNCSSVSNLTLQDHGSLFKVPNKPLRRQYVSKKPLPVPLNKTKVQEILDNLPISELKRKKPKSVAKSKPKRLNLSDDCEKIKRNPCIIPTRLKKPKKWITPKFYQFIIKKLTPRFGIKNRVKAEEVVCSLVDYVNRTMNENSHYYEIVEEMKSYLAGLGIIKTHLDFHELVHNFFDGRFYNKLFPLHLQGVDNWNPFEPDDLSESIL